MTDSVAAQTPVTEHVGNGVTTSFAYTFQLLDSADLVVELDGVVQTSGYTVSGVGVLAGGSVLFTSAPASDVSVLLRRSTDLSRSTSYTYAGDLRETVVDEDFNRLWHAMQERAEVETRALRAPVGETLDALPPASQRASTQLLFDDTGEPYCGAPVSGSAADVMLQYASSDTGKGASLLGVEDAAGDWSGTTQEAVNTELGFLLIRSGAPVNALRAFSAAEQAAIIAKTSTTDHQTQLADLLGNNRAVYFPHGRYNGSAAITITGRLSISAGKGAELRFTDGAYQALRVTGAGAAYFTMRDLYIRGTNNTTPLITLLRQDTQAGYSLVENCIFSHAEKCLDMDGVYITNVIGNMFAVANQYVLLDDTTYGTAGNVFTGNIYGTPVAGNTSTLTYVAAPGYISSAEYYETQQHGCTAIHLASGSVRPNIDAMLEVCGDVVVDTSVEAYLRLRMSNSWHSVNNRAIRINAGSNVYIDHSQVFLSVYDAALTGISAAGGINISNSDVRNFGIGIQSGNLGKISANQIRNCGTGISLTSGATAIVGSDNTFLSNTTDISNNSGGSAKAPGSFTASLTGCTASVTGTARYVVDNDVCTLYLPGLTGTSNATSATITGLPAAIQPSAAVFGTVLLALDNGAEVLAQCDITAGVLTLYRNGSTTGWAAAGTKGVRAQTITYRMRNV